MPDDGVLQCNTMVTLPGSVTFAPGNVGLSTFAAPVNVI